MATTVNHYESTHPGLKNPIADYHVPIDFVDPLGGLGANLMAKLFNKNSWPIVGGPFPYTAAQWTVTATGTGAAHAQAATAGGGILQTAGSTSTFNSNLQAIEIWTPVVNKWVVAACRVQPSDITTVGWEFNIGSSQVDPDTTNYTDVIGFKMAVGAGTIVGKVRGNSGTQAVTSTLYTATAATELFCALVFNLGVPVENTTTTAGTGASSVTQALTRVANILPGDIVYWATTNAYRKVTAVDYAAKTVTVATISTTTSEAVTVFRPSGGFFIGANVDATTFTPFSDDQTAQLALLLTSPPSMYLNLSTKGSAGNPTVLWKSVMASVDL